LSIKCKIWSEGVKPILTLKLFLAKCQLCKNWNESESKAQMYYEKLPTLPNILLGLWEAQMDAKEY
jgi:hypothetical protein